MKGLIGKIVSTKMNKTVVVECESTYTHPLYKKAIRQHNRLKAHSEKTLQLGDTVRIVQTRPMSRDTHFKVSEVISSIKK